MSDRKKKEKKKILRFIFLLIFTGLFVLSAYKTIMIYKGEEQSKQIVNNIREKAIVEKKKSEEIIEESLNKVKESETEDDKENDKENEKEDEQIPIEVDFDILKEECKDIVAWIYCPETVINYPIVQGPDNQFYLKKLISGEYNTAGTLFIDFRNEKDFSDKKTIVYGHNMKNKTMFGNLPMYAQQEYYDKHPEMYLITAEENYKIELFSSFVTPSDSDVYKLSIDNFESWISELKKKSDFKSDVEINSMDRIIILSTCSYEYETARRVVVGVLKEL